MEIRSEDLILEELVAMVAAATRVSDWRRAAEALQILRATARGINRLQKGALRGWRASFYSYAQGQDLDDKAMELLPDELLRELEDGRRAIGGDLLFYRDAEATAAEPVPAGTAVLSTVSGETYYTMEATAYAEGATVTSPAVGVACARKGTVGNCAAGDIAKLAAQVGTSTHCENQSSIGNGASVTDDPAYLERIQRFMRGRGIATPDALILKALSVDDATYGACRYAKLVRPTLETRGLPTLVIDDGTGLLSAAWESVTEGAILLDEAGGGERELYLRDRPARVLQSNETPAIYNDGTQIAATVVAPWGLVRLAAPLEAGAGPITAGAYKAWIGLVAAVQLAIDGDMADPVNVPTVVSAGEICTVIGAGRMSTSRADNLMPIDVNLVLDSRATGATASAVYAELKRQIATMVNLGGVEASLYRVAISVLCQGHPMVKNVLRVLLDGADADKHPPARQVIRTGEPAINVR